MRYNPAAHFPRVSAASVIIKDFDDQEKGAYELSQRRQREQRSHAAGSKLRTDEAELFKGGQGRGESRARRVVTF
jgi:hypothetical protein